MQRSTIICLLLLFITSLNAQSYRTSAGLRFDSDKSLGITIQQLLHKNYTLEGMVLTNTNNGSTSIGLFVEQHQKFLIKNFNIYFGVGLHKTWLDRDEAEEDEKGGSGPAGIVGVEASMGRFNFSWDVQPKANVWGGERFFNMNTGFSIRYIIVKKKKKKINLKFWEKWKRDGKGKKKKKGDKKWWQIRE